MRLYALRGATTVTANDRDAILAATDELMREILERNALAAEDLVCCIFTLTEDLDAEFPAVAAREMGLSARAAAVHARGPRAGRAPARHPRAHPLLRRADGHEPQHVYLGEAAALRLDLTGAQ